MIFCKALFTFGCPVNLTPYLCAYLQVELREECVRETAGLMSGVRVSARSHWSNSSNSSSSVGPPRALIQKRRSMLSKKYIFFKNR